MNLIKQINECKLLRALTKKNKKVVFIRAWVTKLTLRIEFFFTEIFFMKHLMIYFVNICFEHKTFYECLSTFFI